MFDLTYTYKFRNMEADSSLEPVSCITEIYLPARRYAEAIKGGSASIELSDGHWNYNESVGRPDTSLG